MTRHGRKRPQASLSGLGMLLGVIVGASLGIAAFGLLDPILKGLGL